MFGPESRQSQDQTIRLDRIFAELFDFLDQRIGLDNVLITLSADHGFMNVPEYSQSRRLDAGRVDPDKMIAATNAALSAKGASDGRYYRACPAIRPLRLSQGCRAAARRAGSSMTSGPSASGDARG